ncbi:MAG: histidine--tRNA ligase [Acidobacteriia bacterium]|nr:histidine--tRNA ligase [Terriglobia bacterium]
MIKSPRGTRDLLPPDTALWNFVEATVRDVFRAYNFHEIRTPIFESTELFARGVGEETDIVSKEMFTWEDRGRGAISSSGSPPRSKSVSGADSRSGSFSGAGDSDRGQSLTLRPENTAGVVRAYIEHKLWDRGLNKLFYIGPQFRRERPQKGRYRQFYQIGAEVIGPAAAGSQSPARDAEILELLATLLDRVGITNWTLELNSVGCPADRAKFNEALRQALAPVVDKMCADCQRRAVTNPLRVFDCKVPADQPIIDTLPTISQFLDEDCRTHYEAVKDILNAVQIPYQENLRLVRGLDYYQKTAFEFTHGALGAQNAILGGGRYDGLSEDLGGPAAPGIGFAIGEDRLVLSLTASAESVVRKPDVYIAPLGAGMNREAARVARELRRHDLVVDLGDEAFRLKKSFEAADKMGARYILIVGENEVKANAFALKHLASGEQVTVPRGQLAERIVQK